MTCLIPHNLTNPTTHSSQLRGPFPKARAQRMSLKTYPSGSAKSQVSLSLRDGRGKGEGGRRECPSQKAAAGQGSWLMPLLHPTIHIPASPKPSEPRKCLQAQTQAYRVCWCCQERWTASCSVSHQFKDLKAWRSSRKGIEICLEDRRQEEGQRGRNATPTPITAITQV